MSIGERIKEARIRRGLTQQQLAEAIGVANNTITGYEKGTREPDSLKINAIAKILNVSGDYLLGTEYDWLPSAAAMSIAQKYDRLDAHSREAIDWLIDHELKRPRTEATTTIEESAAWAESRRIDDAHADEQTGG